MNTTRKEIRMLTEDIMDYVAERFEKRFKENKIEFKKEMKKQIQEILTGNQKIFNNILKEFFRLTK